MTIVTKGMVDHSDSLGCGGRFGGGDVQWLTSGKGVIHAEMFPLLNEDDNSFELFQLWLNLPAKSKRVEPHYKMLWSEDIPRLTEKDENGNEVIITLVAGKRGDRVAPSPSPDSWAADPANEVQIWTIQMAANAEFDLPITESEVTRSLYFYEGAGITIGETQIQTGSVIELKAREKTRIKNGPAETSLFFLQGKPMNEPLIQHGPFVANSQAEMQAIIQEFNQTQFGGWPWPSSDPVHEKSKGRFAKYADGTEVIK